MTTSSPRARASAATASRFSSEPEHDLAAGGRRGDDRPRPVRRREDQRLGPRGSRNSRGDAPASKPSIRCASRSPPVIAVSPSSAFSARASSISAQQRTRAVAGGQRLRDRRGRPHQVDDDSERRRSRLGWREGDVDAAPTSAASGPGLRYGDMSAPMRCYRHPNRETYVSCSECGRPICPECMTPAPVGQRCPEHSGKPQGVRRVTTGARRGDVRGHRRARHEGAAGGQRRSST